MAAINYIRARRYNEAINVLNGIGNRSGRWYYLSSVANMGLGNNVVAQDYAKRQWNSNRITWNSVSITSSCRMAADLVPLAVMEVPLEEAMGAAMAVTVVTEATEAAVIIPVAPEISVVICGVRTPSVSVWEETFAHVCKQNEGIGRSGTALWVQCPFTDAGNFYICQHIIFYGAGSISHRFFHSSVRTAIRRNAAVSMYFIGCDAEPGQISLDPVWVSGDLHFFQ